MHIVLDLDETLISITTLPTGIKDAEFTFILNGNTYYGKKRPGLDLFLTFAFKRFKTVSIWTAATEDYAYNVVMNIMTPAQRKKLAFLKTRKDLAHTSDNPKSYFKPLEQIFQDPKAIKLGLTKEDTIMIDDRADVLSANQANGIMIPPWKGDRRDKYLPKLLIILDGVLHHNLGFGHYGGLIDLKHLVD